MKELPIIILHGWASQVEKWQPVVKEFKNAGLKVFLPSLPGFSKDNQIQKPWQVSDYTNWLKDYLTDNKIKNYLLLGHSFGGRIAINLASQNPNGLKGLILVASAGIRPPSSLKKILFFVLAKTGKVFFFLPPFCFFKKLACLFLYKLSREKDYFLASSVMKRTLQKAISFDQRKELKKIKKPTLILWGDKDKDTSLADARLINKEIKNSQFIIFSNTFHGLPFQKTEEMVREIIKFTKYLQ